jgi:hypothetical protein
MWPILQEIYTVLRWVKPQEARLSETWFRENNAAYIDWAVQVAPEQMVQPEFPEFAANWLKRAELAGYGQEEFAAVIKTLRQQA